MALETLAAGLEIRGKDTVSPTLAKVGRGFGRLQRKGADLRRGLGLIGRGLKGLARGGAAVGIALGLSANKVTKFEEQMSVVRSVLQKSGPEYDALKLKIKQLGATTVFTATEAAQGAEFLSRAGFTATEQLSALAGTLDAAAAEAIPLGSAANIVANNVRAFGMDASDATRVADVMAKTAAKTNTNMIQLGEALKFAAPEARALGLDIEQTAFSLGVLANAGLQGTIGGTAFKNMLIKLGRPTEKVKGQLNELGIIFQDTEGNMLPIMHVIKNIAQGTSKLQGNLKKTAFLTDFLGLRGKAAAQNLVAAFETMGEEQFQKLSDQIQNAAGSAKKMAEIRLENVRGAFKLLGSAMEGLQIELFESRLLGMRRGIQLAARAISVVVIGLQQTKEIMAGGTTPELEELRKKLGPATDTLLQFAFGIKEGMSLLNRGVSFLKRFADRMGLAFGENSEMARGIGRFLTVALPLFAAISSIALVAGVVLGPLASLGAGILIVLKALAGLAAVAGVAFLAIRGMIGATARDGQSFKDRFMEIFYKIKTFVTDFVSEFKSQWLTIKIPILQIVEEIKAFGGTFTPILETVGFALESTAGSGESFAFAIVTVIGVVLRQIKRTVSVLTFIFGVINENFIGPVIASVVQIVRGFINLITGAKTVKQSLLQIFKGVGIGLMNLILAPLRLTLDLLIKLGEKAGLNVGGAGMKGLKKIRDTMQGRAGTLLGVEKPKKQEFVGPEAPSMLDKLKSSLDAKDQARVAANKPPNVQVDSPKPSDVNAEIDNKLCVDGKAMTVASARAKVELSERMGRVQNPRQAKQVINNGDLPAGAR